MPTLTINAEMAIHEDGAAVHLFVDGKQLKGVGPFPNWETARWAAEEIIDEMRRLVMPSLEATTAGDLQPQ